MQNQDTKQPPGSQHLTDGNIMTAVDYGFCNAFTVAAALKHNPRSRSFSDITAAQKELLYSWRVMRAALKQCKEQSMINNIRKAITLNVALHQFLDHFI